MCLHLSATQEYGIKTSQKIQMHFVKAASVIIEACHRVMDSKLKSALCKETVTPLIDSSHS